MRIAIIGAGYVGLVSGACLAEKGHSVTIVDMNPQRVKDVNDGHCPVHEAGLPELLKNNLGSRINATADLAAAVQGSELTMLAVGTPFDGNEIDLSQVKAAAESVGHALASVASFHVVVVKSTVVPGTTEKTVLTALEKTSGKKADKDFGVSMNPEFLREGSAVDDFMNPDRIVLGSRTVQTQERLTELYAPFTGTDIVHCNIRTAEMIKYASNALLATLISFSNTIGNLCSASEAVDVADVLEGVCLDNRWSPIQHDGSRVVPDITSYLAAGCGFGGSCFPKDVNALVAFGKSLGVNTDLLDAVVSVNVDQPHKLIGLLKEKVGSVSGKRVTVLGIAFKPGTDDIRESPSLIALSALREAGADVVTYDPQAMGNAKTLFPEGVNFAESLEHSLDKTDAVLIMTAWPEFRAAPELLKKSNNAAWIIDGRQLFRGNEPDNYVAIGVS